MHWLDIEESGIVVLMPRSLIYIALMLIITAGGVADGRHESGESWGESSFDWSESHLANCDEAIVAARASPYWRNQSLAGPLAMDCHPALGGWRLKASATTPEELCELYVGHDRLIVPRLPCQGIGFLEHEL